VSEEANVEAFEERKEVREGDLGIFPTCWLI
jgi:hypothetical protein